MDGVRSDFPAPIIPKIVRNMTREAVIKLHQIVMSNVASIAPNLDGGCHDYLALKMTVEDYLAQTCHLFSPLHNQGYLPPIKGTTQEQKLGTERFRNNQALFRLYTDMKERSRKIS